MQCSTLTIYTQNSKRKKTAQKERESSLTAENKSKNKVFGIMCRLFAQVHVSTNYRKIYIKLLANAMHSTSMPFQLHIIAIHLYFVYAISCTVYEFHIHHQLKYYFILLNCARLVQLDNFCFSFQLLKWNFQHSKSQQIIYLHIHTNNRKK